MMPANSLLMPKNSLLPAQEFPARVAENSLLARRRQRPKPSWIKHL